MLKNKFVRFFGEISIKDVPVVGGKNASLGEMFCQLNKYGIKIPNGFATTADGYNYFLEKSGAKKKLEKILTGLDVKNINDLEKKGELARIAILESEMPKDFKEAIVKSYRELCKFYKKDDAAVAVRSSATAEDLPDASFAGQQETFLNIRGEKELLIAVKKCIASLFTNRAISYRADKGFDHFKIALSVGVQKMIRADLGSSGVMFTIDTESGFANTVLINSIYGLGENIVQGAVTPDEFYVFKPAMMMMHPHLEDGSILKKLIQKFAPAKNNHTVTNPIISRALGKKNIKMIYGTSPAKPTINVKVDLADQKKSSITDEQVVKLAEWGMIIENHYRRAMDIEWALDGITKELYIIQARPETIHSVKNYNIIEEYKLKNKSQMIVSGSSVGAKIGAGVVNRIMKVKDINKFKPGEVLVTDMTDPDWEPIMKIASAIVTDKGGRTCHAAIISRELGIPCVVGTGNASAKIKSGDKITVDCAEGEIGKVYAGILPFKKEITDIENFTGPKTKVMMNVGEPGLAFTLSFTPNDGVGLARLEFIINNAIKIHPLALINYNKITDAKVKKQIDNLTDGYKDKKQFFVDKLAEGVATIAAAFYPKDVIVRLSDFKTNEYANLIGGREYEPTEDNPMIGWRGASRYYSSRFAPAFALECAALKKVREEMGLKNVKLMVPFCRTVEEGKKVLEIMAKNGLVQHKDGLEVYVMAEIPANIILVEEFAQVFDGFSIGSNDLTQLTLGIDRDAGNLKVAGVSNEKNDAVKYLIEHLIKACRRLKKKVGICGQGPSDFPDFAQFLVRAGISSISLNPDTVIKTALAIKEAERK
jgi:pyruvate,water dikinase